MNLTIAIYPSRSLFIPLYLLYPRDLKRLEPLTLTLTLYILLLLLLLLLAFRLEREVHAREEGVADLLEDVRLGLGVRHLVGVITR